MKFRILQLDTSSTTPDRTVLVQDDLNKFAKKAEASGYKIFAEDFLPQLNSVRSLMMVAIDKEKGEAGARYSYFVFDSRNGFGLVDKLIAEKTIDIEKSGREIVRCKLVPMRNDAFVQLLLVHVEKRVEPVPVEPSAGESKGGEKNEGPTEGKANSE